MHEKNPLKGPAEPNAVIREIALLLLPTFVWMRTTVCSLFNSIRS